MHTMVCVALLDRRIRDPRSNATSSGALRAAVADDVDRSLLAAVREVRIPHNNSIATWVLTTRLAQVETILE